MRSGMLYKGRVLFFLDGKLYHEEDNMVVDAGLNLASNLLFTTTTNAQVTHMGLGSGTTAEAPTQTTLVTPLMISGSVQRKVFDAAPTRAGAVTTINCTFAPGQATGSVNEAGLFTAVSAGIMFSRIKTGVTIPKDAGVELRVQWVITAQRP
ncbi:hypothetical protein [Achromobacter phage hasilly_LB3]|nr:hypothetical protein [Achromobacter phage hasilly_LB3]WNO48727.1 hypothetical protein [Achromobacter phage nyaak_TL1]WNO48921.1 hypothetical protein [Achromobacter phage ewii_LB8]